MFNLPSTLRDLSEGRFPDAVSKVLGSQSIILDVDYDFFCRSEDVSYGKSDDKKIDQSMFGEFFDLQDATLFVPVVGHDESLQVWLDQGVKAATCIHFDYHHDCYVAHDRINGCSLSRVDEIINIANYLPFARKCGLLSHVIWVVPNELIDIEADEYVSDWIAEGFLSVISWAEYLQIHEVIVTKIAASGHTVALSPDFVSPTDLGHFFDFFKCDEEFQYRALDYGYFSVLANRAEMRWRWHSLNLSNRCQIFFHGSPVQGLTYLKNTHCFNFVSPSRRFASCFESNLVRADALSLGIEPFNKDPDTIVVSGAAHLLNIFKCEVGSTYAVSIDGIPADFTNGCSGFEFTIDGDVDNLSEGAGQLTQAIEHDPGLLIVYPHELMTLPKKIGCPEYKKFIAWMGIDDTAVRSLPSSAFYSNIFSELQGEEMAQFFPLITWYRFGSRELFAGLRALGVATEVNGYHGLQHCLDVGLLGILLANLNKVPATPIFLAALAHDLRRDALKDHHNAPDSAVLCRELMNSCWAAYASKYDDEIVEAVACHSSMQQPSSITAAILRDADRLRLSWERGFDSRFFETEWGKEFAKRDSSFAENVLTRLSFANGSVLEINLQGRTADLVVLNRKFACSPSLLIDSGVRARFINHYKVTKIMIYGVGPQDGLRQLESPFLSDGVVVVNQGRYGAGYRTSSNASKDWAAFSSNDISHLVGSFEAEEVQIRITSDTVDEVIDNIDSINNKQINMVVPGTSAAVKTIIKRLISALMVSREQSVDAMGAKIICDVAWCHFVQPEEALTYFEKIDRQYSSIVSLSTMSGVGDMVRAITVNELERHDECGECAFSLHCPKRDLEHGSWTLGQPVFQSSFQGWNPYVID